MPLYIWMGKRIKSDSVFANFKFEVTESCNAACNFIIGDFLAVVNDYKLTTKTFLFLRCFALFFFWEKKQKSPETLMFQGFQVVEVAGFEPTTFWSRT